MIVYTIGFLLPIIFMCINRLENDTKIKRHITNKVVLYTGAYMFLVSALRKSSIGADTNDYMQMFEYVVSKGTEAFSQGTGRQIEIGYMWFQYICSFFTSSPQVYIGIIALIVAVVVGRFVKKYSKNPAWSMFLYMTYFFQFYGLTGCRQTLAAMILILSYDCICEKKIIRFTLLIILATLFHNSAWMFFPMYFLANQKVTYNRAIAILIMVAVLFALRTRFMGFLTDVMIAVTGDEYYDAYRGGVFNIRNYFMMALAITILCVYRYKEVIEKNPRAAHYYNAIFLSLLFASTGNTRLMQYFWIFIILLCPEVIDELESRDKLIVGILLPLLLGTLMLSSYSKYAAIAPYQFFWQ